uniref:Beta-defensin n=1 Tax=Ficedula albicollis TaxID=59894 RepID=A0A803VV25_FICAL
MSRGLVCREIQQEQRDGSNLSRGMVCKFPVVLQPRHGQPKGFCDGYCAHACGETEEWSFSPYCEELHCCIPSPKKGK